MHSQDITRAVPSEPTARYGFCAVLRRLLACRRLLWDPARAHRGARGRASRPAPGGRAPRGGRLTGPSSPEASPAWSLGRLDAAGVGEGARIPFPPLEITPIGRQLIAGRSCTGRAWDLEVSYGAVSTTRRGRKHGASKAVEQEDAALYSVYLESRTPVG